MTSRAALIVATTSHDDPTLRGLKAPSGDALDLASVLQDPAIGGFDVDTLLNAGSATVAERIESFFAEDRRTTDLLLLYFSGHGIKDDNGRLYFATANTRVGRLRSTAVPAELVHDVMAASRARRQVVVLDCCYSGAFAKGLIAKGDARVGVRDQLEGRGRVILTASDALQYSFEDAGTVEGGSGRSLFTRALVDGLRSGAADLDGDGRVTLDELYDFVHDRLADERSAQSPRKWAFDVAGDIVVATAPAREMAPVPEPEPEPPAPPPGGGPDPERAEPLPAPPPAPPPPAAEQPRWRWLPVAAVAAVAILVLALVAMLRGDGDDRTATVATGGGDTVVDEGVPSEDAALAERLVPPSEGDPTFEWEATPDQDPGDVAALPCGGSASVRPVASATRTEFRDGGAIIWDAFVTVGLLEFAAGDGVVFVRDIEADVAACDSIEPLNRTADHTIDMPVLDSELYFRSGDSGLVAVARSGNTVAMVLYEAVDAGEHSLDEPSDFYALVDPAIASAVGGG